MIFSGIDNGFDMWDLSKASEKEIAYTVDFIALGMEDTDVLKASSESDNKFYTYYPLKVKNKSNSSAMSKGYDHIVVKHPRNKFSEIIKKNLDDVAQVFSVVQNPKLFFKSNVHRFRVLILFKVTLQNQFFKFFCKVFARWSSPSWLQARGAAHSQAPKKIKTAFKAKLPRPGSAETRPPHG